MQRSRSLGGVRWNRPQTVVRFGLCRSRVAPTAFRSPFPEKPKSNPGPSATPGEVLLRQLSRVASVEKPQRIPFTSIQFASGVLLSGALLSTGSLNRGAGYLLITLCVSISLSGYIRCLYRSRGAGRLLEMCLGAQEMAKQSYSFCAAVGSPHALDRFFLSPFYEPSVIYMMLNCWGLYAVGQATLCTTAGGYTVVLICALAFFLGRLGQFLVTRVSTPGAVEPKGSCLEASAHRERLVELFLLPNGTWGFGPLLNALIWFCCFACPYQLYPATPTGVLAPVWTAVGVPVLLLLEDVYSLWHASRRAHKIETGSTPGLQIAAFVVGAFMAGVVR